MWRKPANPPVFSEKKSRGTEYCNVDLLVLKKGKIRVIIEIEETNIGPTQICGKFLTSALARYYIHETMNNKLVGMHDSTTFIQILDSSKLKADKTSKFDQWKNLEHSINNILPVKESNITDYRLFYGDRSYFMNREKCSDLVVCIQEACR
ncbi:MAG: hypothetical protein RTU30_02470 [Candidatus Thorarchaeota archaeon]